MKFKLITILIIFWAPYSLQATEGEFSTYSNYIWRGTTFSENKPTIQLTLDNQSKQGYFINTFFSNAEFKDEALGENSSVTQEMDVSLGKRWSLKNGEIQVAYNNFVFPGAEVFNSDELNIYVNYNNIILELSYMNDFFGYKSDYKYIRLGHEWNYSTTTGSTLFIGYNAFNNPKGKIKQKPVCASCAEYFETTTGAGNPDYIDIYLTNRKTMKDGKTFELAFNWTNRHEFSVENGVIEKTKAQDFAIIIGLGLPFKF